MANQPLTPIKCQMYAPSSVRARKLGQCHNARTVLWSATVLAGAQLVGCSRATLIHKLFHMRAQPSGTDT